MIESVSGNIEELTPTAAVVATPGGVAYRLEITLPVFTALEGKKDVRLLVHEAIREDAYTLYGFLEERERNLFRLLIGVSGVGANTARLILSSITVNELEHIIPTGDYSRLKAVKGIGLKTAQRIIVDLKGKIQISEDTDNLLQDTSTPDSETFNEALAALTMLGFTRQASHKVLKNLFSSNPDLRVEEAIKKALALLH